MRINKKKFIYLISPNKITKAFYNNLSEVLNLNCDNSKILQKTNWLPKHNFKSGLIKTINWVKENINELDSKQYTI